MTVHRAKGLEFPVVILADITCNETRAERVAIYRAGVEAGARWNSPDARRASCRSTRRESIERDEEEAIRLLYVAATRARDLIVVPAVGDEESDGWLARLNPVVYPATDGAARARLDASCGMPRIRRRQRADAPAQGAGQSEIGGAGITSRADRVTIKWSGGIRAC